MKIHMATRSSQMPCGQHSHYDSTSEYLQFGGEMHGTCGNSSCRSVVASVVDKMTMFAIVFKAFVE